uniref:Serine carboxypeptidase-like 49 n=1 Tax=Nicotiana tabacum TaxID=4097 RepID=A0A1S4A1D0_TOBAC|nr:PREDICTED: serine carboxypeptidase-like 49 [Nicotiana tabacum]
MAQMKLSLSVSLFLTLLLLSPSSFAKVSISSKLASKQAEKLIHELNLFPKESDNIVDRDPFPTAASRIVEKRFSFPNLANSSIISFEDLGHHAGYYKIKHSHAARLFYFFFESQGSKDDPVVIWLSGGPGCSSELALFYENGPFSIANNLSLVLNEYGWDKVIN